MTANKWGGGGMILWLCAGETNTNKTTRKRGGEVRFLKDMKDSVLEHYNQRINIESEREIEGGFINGSEGVAEWAQLGTNQTNNHRDDWKDLGRRLQVFIKKRVKKRVKDDKNWDLKTISLWTPPPALKQNHTEKHTVQIMYEFLCLLGPP